MAGVQGAGRMGAQERRLELLGRICANPSGLSMTPVLCCGVLLVVLGLCWAMVGVAHLVRLSQMTGANAPSDGMAGLRLPSRRRRLHHSCRVLLAFLGLVLFWRAKRAQRRATGATPPGGESSGERPLTLIVLTAIPAVHDLGARHARSSRRFDDCRHRRSAKLEARTIRATSNPILSGGADYTADPAPLVAGGNFYILTGRDTARQG